MSRDLAIILPRFRITWCQESREIFRSAKSETLTLHGDEGLYLNLTLSHIEKMAILIFCGMGKVSVTIS